MLSTMRTVAVLSLSIAAFSHLSAAATASSSAAASSTVVAGTMTSAGCFNSSNPLSSQGSYTYQSTGYCQKLCVAKGATVMGLTGGDTCYCGTELPSKSSLQSDSSDCDTSCNGYPDDNCGGDGFWSVFYTSDDTDIDYYSGSASSSSGSSGSGSSTTEGSSKTTDASSATGKATVITSIAPGKTVIITQAPAAAASTSTSSASDSQKSSHHSSNTAGIAAGVVVGIVVLAALIGAAFFFYRRRQRQMAEDAFNKRQQIPAGEYSSSRPMTFKPNPGPDARLDHDAMAHRRMSDGSIADNEDYSRRILKVTNPDDR